MPGCFRHTLQQQINNEASNTGVQEGAQGWVQEGAQGVQEGAQGVQEGAQGVQEGGA